MACSQTLSSINTDCGSVLGGIVEVYAHNKADVTAITVSDGEVTAVTLGTSAPAAAVWKFRKQSSGLTSTWNIDDTAGVKYVSSEITLRFAKLDTAKRVSIMAMANAEMIIIVKDQNGKCWLLGEENPVTISAGTASTGTAFSDANEYNVTLSDMSSELPHAVSGTAVTTFINA